MPIATFVHGTPLMVDHTPAAAVAAGDIVVVGDEARIAHSPIAADALGALAAPAGTAVYRVPKAAGVGTAVDDGKRLWWDATSEVATETQSTHKPLGVSVGASVDADETLLVRHTYFSKDA